MPITARLAIPAALGKAGQYVSRGGDRLRAILANHKTVLDDLDTAVGVLEGRADSADLYSMQASLDVAADNVTGWVFVVPPGGGGTVASIKVYALNGAPVSSLGTYLLAVAGGGNNLLAAATFDLETLVGDTLTALSLTATAGDLVLAAGDAIVVTATSNNADLTGANALLISVDMARA